jgi:hypothetical protein
MKGIARISSADRVNAAGTIVSTECSVAHAMSLTFIPYFATRHIFAYLPSAGLATNFGGCFSSAISNSVR